MRKSYGLVLLAVFGCASGPIDKGTALKTLPMNTCEAIEAFFAGELNAYQDKVDVAFRDFQDEQWKSEVADPMASLEKMSKYFEVAQQAQYDQAILQQVKNLSAATDSLDVKKCPIKRRLLRAKAILEAGILSGDELIKMEKSNQDSQDAMANKSNGFRIQVAGEKDPISMALYRKKLRTTDDRAVRESLYKAHNSARTKAWLSYGFRDLIHSRNAEGRRAGFSNYYDYKFFRSQLDLKLYRKMSQEVKKALAPAAHRVLKQFAKAQGITNLQPWDVNYVREKAAAGEVNALLESVQPTDILAISKYFWSAMGFDIDSYGFTMDLFPRPGKNTHAFAMGVMVPHIDSAGNVLSNPKMDIRFMANFRKPVQWDDISTAIHELGHAIHFGEVRQTVGVFRNIGSVDAEAIAMTTERMAESPEFLKEILPRYTKVNPAQLEAITQKLSRSTRIEQAFTILRQIFFSEFEEALYLNPEQDLAKLWAKLYQEYFGIALDVQYADWDIDHFIMAPVYVHNYAIGIMMVEQFYESILAKFQTSYQSKAIGDYLRKVYFSPGLEYNYLELTRRFTGKPLSTQSVLKLLEGI